MRKSRIWTDLWLKVLTELSKIRHNHILTALGVKPLALDDRYYPTCAVAIFRLPFNWHGEVIRSPSRVEVTFNVTLQRQPIIIMGQAIWHYDDIVIVFKKLPLRQPLLR